MIIRFHIAPSGLHGCLRGGGLLCGLFWTVINSYIRTTLGCTYRTVGKVRRPFTPCHPFAHYSHTVRTVVASYSQSYSHTILTLFARSHTIRTLFARSHTIRTLFARSHSIRTVALYSHTFRTVAHYSRGSHTIRAIVLPNSHTIRTSPHPGRTIRAVGVSPFALAHAVFTQFTPVRICECAIRHAS